jgi:hypothetical protein
MALQQINWTQIDTSNVPSGSIIDLGAVSGTLRAVYADNLYISGVSLGLSSDGLNLYTASLKNAIETTGSNLTVKGNLLVKGTTTAIDSTTVSIGDNIIELNGSSAANGGLLIKDVTSPNTISGSLLWDSSLDYWKAGQLGSEEKLIRQSDFTSLSSSLSSSINTLSGSLSHSISLLSSSLSSSITILSSSFSASITNLQDTNIWQPTGSFYGTSQNIKIIGSGSLLNSPDGAVTGKYALEVSQSIHAANINVGIPTSNNWKTSLEGSYFNNFDKNTDVSEILRFVAGLLSSSAPDASPNTKGYGSYTKNNVNTTTGTVTVGSIPQNSTNTTITYLQGKGFATTGSTIFSGVTPIYTQTNYGHTFTSVSSGTTIVSSSVDSQLFGLGTLSSGTPTSLKVSGSFTFKFKNNSSKTDTSTSGSQSLITQTGAGTTSGVSLARINTANNAVIPPAYQDGKFATVFSPSLYGASSDVSSSGYYHISSSISIASGSSAFTTPIDSYTEVFYAPLSTISTNVPAQTPTFSGVSVNAISAVSRSLSGAPYLSSATYTISGSILGLFNPLYYAGTGIATITDSDSLVTESGGVLTVSTAGGTIQTANAVYDSTGVTARGTGTVPYETDIVKVYTTSSFSPGVSDENINQTGLGTTSFSLQINGLNKAGSTTTNTSTVSYHTAGNFGQPSASGSLEYYGRPQTGDTATALVESFTGEGYRLVVDNNILSFSGTSWTTSFSLYNLGTIDLQVKPGYLVKPGGTYGYWLTNPSNASDYKYYIRKFSTTGTKSLMTINLGQVLVGWDATTNNSVSVGILFESSKSTSPYVTSSRARIYDPSKTLANFVSTISGNTDGQNPFGSSIDLYGNSGGSLSSTTYTIPIRNADGMYINATYDEIYVIVKYKGDPTPITGITVAFS